LDISKIVIDTLNSIITIVFNTNLIFPYIGESHLPRAGRDPVEVAEVHGHGGLAEDGGDAAGGAEVARPAAKRRQQEE
jgi:hypothetical protein